MDALAQKKTAEAKQHIADAEKSLKTSLFKRKPDYESAAISYNSAATCYKVIKDLNKSIEYFQKSAQCYNDNNALYSAAKQYEQVAFLANEAKNYALTVESIEKAADLMLTSGVRDSAGIIIERAANMLKLNDPEKALKLYKKAIHIADVEEKYHEMVGFYENSVALALRTNQYNEAVEIINESFKVLDRVGTVEQIVKYILTVILIHLNRDDWVSAKQYLEESRNRYDVQGGGFTKVEELLEAYDEKDDDKLKAIIKNYLSYAVDNEALKLANKIIKSEEWIRETSELKQQQQSKPNDVKHNTHQSNYANPSSRSVDFTGLSEDEPPVSTSDAHPNQNNQPNFSESNSAAHASAAANDDDEEDFDLR